MADAPVQESTALSEFGSYYRREMQDWLAAQEGRKQQVASRRRIALGVTAGVVVLVAIAALTARSKPLMYGLLVLIPVVVGVGLYAHYKLGAGLAQDVGNFVMSKVCAFLDLSYAGRITDMPLDRFSAAGLLPVFQDSILGHGMHGKRGDIALRLCGAELTIEVPDPNDREDTETKAVFGGILMELSLPRPFSGCTLVTNDADLMQGVLRKLTHPATRVRFDDEAFESRFEAYGTDEAATRALLTPEVRNQLIDLEDALAEQPTTSGAVLGIAFDAQLMLVAIDNCTPSFDTAAQLERLEDPMPAQRIVEEIVPLVVVAEELAKLR